MTKIYDVTFEQGQGGQTGSTEQDNNKRRQQRGGMNQDREDSDQSQAY